MDWLSVGLGVLSVVGIPLAFIWGRRNRQKPDLRSSTDFDQVMAPLSFAGGLRLTWNGRSLEQVSRTNIALWNERGDTVRGGDIVPADKLRIAVADDDEILQVRVASFSREQVQLAVEGAEVSFDFLDENDGGVLEVLHRGDKPAALKGTIRGAKIRAVADSDLSPSARTASRLPAAKRFFAPGPGRSLRFLWAANLILGLVALGGIAFLLSQVFGRLPMLVNPGAYDLSTVEGQADFAKRVFDSGQGSQLIGETLPLYIIMATVIVVMLALITWRLLRSMRSIAPTTIFAISADGPEDATKNVERSAPDPGATPSRVEAEPDSARPVVNVRGTSFFKIDRGRLVRFDSGGLTEPTDDPNP